MRNLFIYLLCFLPFGSQNFDVKNRHQGLVTYTANLPVEQGVSQSESKDSLSADKIEGIASWYSYKGGMFAASTKFKKGSILRVINQSNGKHVDVVINDYGPDPEIHPDRIIDLDIVAFHRIAHLETGVINIIIRPLKII